MKVSIVTISYNQADFLEKCMESVLGQNYPDIEYIVVDPGSTDGSRDIIKRYADRIAAVIYEPDQGPADGLNKGFSSATGEVYCYLNADDILLPGALSHVADMFSSRQDIDVIVGNGYQLDRDGNKVRKIFSNRWSLRGYAYGAVNIVQQSTFFRRGIYSKTHGFNISNRTCWDGELLVDLALVGARFVRTTMFLGGFRVHEGSISGSGRLNDQYARDSHRIKEMILGRPWHKTDTAVSWLYRSYKYLAYPVQTYSRLRWGLSLRKVRGQMG